MQLVVGFIGGVLLAIGVFELQKLQNSKLTSDGTLQAESKTGYVAEPGGATVGSAEQGDVALMEGAVPDWNVQGVFSGDAPQKPSEAQSRIEGVDTRRIIQLSAWKPRAYLYKGFLTPEECDHIINTAQPRMERSLAASDEDGGSSPSDIRTSTGMFFSKGQDDVIRGIEQRVSKWTFLPVVNQESLQVLRYTEGQKDEPHVDYFHDATHTKMGGHRYATILMYLNSVEVGGETVFPEKKDDTPRDDTWSDCAKGSLAVKPQKGDALLFFSMHPDGTPDSSSLHYTCPVLKGMKWSAPMWVRVDDYTKEYSKEQDSYGNKESYNEGNAKATDSACVDTNEMCASWAESGECTKNAKYMMESCKKACLAC